MSNHSSASSRNARRRPRPRVDTPPAGKRERILDAAVKVFAREGFYNAKVSQIADQAGVADGTIYLYFKSKDELLISLFEDRMDRVLETLRGALEAQDLDITARLRKMIELQLELIEQNPEMAEVITVELRQSAKFIREYHNPKFAEFLRLIAGTIALGQKRGELRADVDPQFVARALFGALDEISLAWIVRTPREQNGLRRAAKQLANLFLDGLRVGPLPRASQSK
jgi:TetR/AcrR family fatty acid metabolism transcriptional regulator